MIMLFLPGCVAVSVDMVFKFGFAFWLGLDVVLKMGYDWIG